MRATETKPRRPASRRGGIVAVSMSVCTVLIAGCGGSGTLGNSKSSSVYAQGVKYSDCMRSHGVSNFPDPNTAGSGASTQSSPADEQSPAYESAQRACADLHPGGKPLQVAISAAEKASMIVNARCVREHGVPNFPDPRFGPTGGVETGALGKDARSPAFVRAVKTCEHIGIPLPGS
jgi:hypothetical protein